MYKLLRAIYSIVLFFAASGRLLWRATRYKALRTRWYERYGISMVPRQRVDLWFHAVSVGEFMAAKVVIAAVLEKIPTKKILVTTATHTGSQVVQQTFGKRVVHVYLPFDLSWCYTIFLRKFRPKLAVILETELWPNLFAALQRYKIKTILLNARLSETSFNNYKKIYFIMPKIFAAITEIVAQSELDKERFLELGAAPQQISVLPNLKWALALPSDLQAESKLLRMRLGGADRFVLLAASTHADEEADVIAIYLQLKIQYPQLLLMLAPRHPERFQTVFQLCLKHGCKVASYTLNESCDSSTDIFLFDTLGKLLYAYAASDVAIVGGSFVPIGGHNTIEAVYTGTIAITGPCDSNFLAVNSELLQHKVLIRVPDLVTLKQVLSHIIEDDEYRQQLRLQNAQFLQQKRDLIPAILAKLR